MSIEFSNQELRVTRVIPKGRRIPDLSVYTYPVSERKAVAKFYAGEPVWQLLGVESQLFTPHIIPDFISRGFVNEIRPFNADKEGGGPDMFGIDWVYVPIAGGSMEKEGSHLMEDANNWEKTIVFPDIDAWDWAGCAQENNDIYLTEEHHNQAWIQTGWFERLISFMGFEDAAVAMIDEDQTEAVAELFLRLSEFYIDLIDHYVEYFNYIDSFQIHDDWGSQNAPFFSSDTAAELIVPAMRMVTDHLHEKGLFGELHSCGCIEKMVPNFIDAGWDSWMPQTCNDTDRIYREFGDKIKIAPIAPPYPENATEEEQRAAAREYVRRYCTTPGKATFFSMYDGALLQPAYREELYIQSRKAYADW